LRLTAGVSLPVSRYSDPSAKADVMRKALEQVRSMPDVESAGIADSLPTDGADSARLSIKTDSSVAMLDETWFLSVGPEFFSTLKIPMLAGRPFRETDVREAPPVAIVNQTFAKQYFPGTNPIDSRLAFADSPTTWREIVGVVSDFRQRNPEEDLRPLVYLPAPIPWEAPVTIAVFCVFVIFRFPIAVLIGAASFAFASPIAIAAFLQHPAVTVWIGKVGETCIVSMRGVKPGCETSVPGSNGRLVTDLTDRDPAFDQSTPRGLKVCDNKIRIAKRADRRIGDSATDLNRTAGARGSELHDTE